MTKPTIHMNGTAAADLLDGYCSVGSAIRAALDKLYEHGPNGRDYYPQGPDAMTAARGEHEDRANRLRSVLAEIEALAEHVSDHT